MQCRREEHGRTRRGPTKPSALIQGPKELPVLFSSFCDPKTLLKLSRPLQYAVLEFPGPPKTILVSPTLFPDEKLDLHEVTPRCLGFWILGLRVLRLLGFRVWEKGLSGFSLSGLENPRKPDTVKGRHTPRFSSIPEPKQLGVNRWASTIS